MTTTSPASSIRAYRVLGTTEDAPGCFCCGRTNLKVYVGMEHLETGETHFFGTTCAAKMEKVAVSVIRAEIAEVEVAERQAAAEARRQAEAVEEAAFFAWVAETYGVKATQAADLWDKIPGMTPFQIRLAWRDAA